jgi:hypothetical protein
MYYEPRINAMQRLIAVLVCTCLVVQPLLVPLHLALEEHTHGQGSPFAPTAVHEHHPGHGHHHAHPHPHPHAPFAGIDSEDGGSHPPHPAEDHLCQPQAQIRVSPPAPDLGPLALLQAPDLAAFEVVIAERPREPARKAPPHPPPRGPTRPRAPPKIV